MKLSEKMSTEFTNLFRRYHRETKKTKNIFTLFGDFWMFVKKINAYI